MVGRIPLFWTAIAAGSLLVALGSASLGFAYANRNYVEVPGQSTDSAGWTNYVPLGVSFDGRVGGNDDVCLGCVDPVPWLAVGIALLVLAVVPFFVAARRR